MANEALSQAKAAKNDEFYTQWPDIEREVMAYIEYNPDVFRGKTVLCPCDDPEWSNFTKFFALHFAEWGLRKLISTSYAVESKKYKADYQPTLFETASGEYDAEKTRVRGKIFTLDGEDVNRDGKIDIDGLKWHYMTGDGDFRSGEVAQLMSEADVVITNPPFSLFREFLKWIVDGGKEFLIITNLNAVTYKEVFPLLKNNKAWMGATMFNGGAAYFIGDNTIYDPTKMSSEKNSYVKDGKRYWRVNGVRWMTNLDHGRRHEPLRLMTEADNIKYSKHKEIKGKGYLHYDNYDAIEVPFTDAIPADYKGVVGVPISFLDKYCPEQFEIVGATESEGTGFSGDLFIDGSTVKQACVKGERKYKRMFIRARGRG